MAEKKEWKYDSEYISYVESGESAAVFVVRDIVNAIETRGKWIDVVSLDTYAGEWFGTAFNWIIVELFPRKTKPVYPKLASDEEKKYITWKTANEDITAQREKGVRGPMFLVLCDLKKIKGKNENEKSKLIYMIRAVKGVTQDQVDFIEENRDSIILKIIKNKKPELIFFGLEPSRKKTEAKKTTDKRRFI